MEEKNLNEILLTIEALKPETPKAKEKFEKELSNLCRPGLKFEDGFDDTIKKVKAAAEMLGLLEDGYTSAVIKYLEERRSIAAGEASPPITARSASR